jgi:hypothetical protein
VKHLDFFFFSGNFIQQVIHPVPVVSVWVLGGISSPEINENASGPLCPTGDSTFPSRHFTSVSSVF